ncbi:MAG: glycosyltransferase [archaeon]
MVPYYIVFYVALIVVYLWYRFFLRFIDDVKSKRTYPPIHEKVTVIIPVYNENKTLLTKCIQSVVEADGKKEIIVIDDGSKNNSWQVIKELKKKYPQIKIIQFKKNRGKREVQFTAFNIATGKFIITVDSDTIIEKNALEELIKPFNDEKIGATTGYVKAYNKDKNFLTKMINARYKNAFAFERRGLSTFGIVTCCSGVISAYRRSVIQKVKHHYISQRFLGQTCTYGDDRHLTNLFIKKGHKIAYVHNAVAYTEVPTTIREYIRQQLRWRKSFLRESFVILPYALKNNFLLTLEIFFNLVIPFFALLARMLIIYLLLILPYLLIPVAISIALIAVLRNLLLFFEEPSYALYSIPFAFFYEAIIYWLYWIALFTLWDARWGTR